MIAQFKKTQRPQWAGAMLLLAVLACVVLTNAYVAKADFEFGTATNLGPAINTTMNEFDQGLSRDVLSVGFMRYQLDWSGAPEAWVAQRVTIYDPGMNL